MYSYINDDNGIGNNFRSCDNSFIIIVSTVILMYVCNGGMHAYAQHMKYEKFSQWRFAIMF